MEETEELILDLQEDLCEAYLRITALELQVRELLLERAVLHMMAG